VWWLLSNRPANLVSKNKLFAGFLIITILVATSTFVLAPAQHPDPKLPTISVPGKGNFDLNAYPVINRKVIGQVNLIRDYYSVTDLSNESVNNLSMLPPFMTQYFLAFTAYSMARIADSTASYRTDYYKQVFLKLIAMMNSSAMEQHEWIGPDFSNASYEGLGNGFRGPTNIMWTGHYALMELFYYSLFRDSRYNDEILGYMDQWNSTLTSDTTWDGRPSNGLGRYGIGLISCEPYIAFVQCNSILFYAMRLYDNLYGTNYQEASLPGIAWWQANIMDVKGVPIDGYYVAQPLDEHRGEGYSLQTYPGVALTKGLDAPKVSGYGSAWVTMFYNAMGMTTLASTIYSNWKAAFVHYGPGDTAYVVESYHFPSDFGISDYVANVFGYYCSRDMGDSALNNKLEKWFYSPFEGRWVGDKYEFDTSALGSLSSFVYPVTTAYMWVHANSTLADLITPRSDSFFSEPYISNQSTTSGLFVYQATYDQTKGAFILTVEMEQGVVLTFDNFPGVQGVYGVNGQYTNWVQEGSQMLLTLGPGTYSFVIV
jgi:hypothetical protein